MALGLADPLQFGGPVCRDTHMPGEAVEGAIGHSRNGRDAASLGGSGTDMRLQPNISSTSAYVDSNVWFHNNEGNECP